MFLDSLMGRQSAVYSISRQAWSGWPFKMVIASLTFGLSVGVIDCLTVLCGVEMGGCRV